MPWDKYSCVPPPPAAAVPSAAYTPNILLPTAPCNLALIAALTPALAPSLPARTAALPAPAVKKPANKDTRLVGSRTPAVPKSIKASLTGAPPSL